MSDQLPLGTKCCVPRLPDPLVGRPRLENVLADGERRPVTLVSGPPGAGKTTLLAAWRLAAPQACTAWMSLDSQDNEPGRLGPLVAAALADAGCVEPPAPDAGDRALHAAFEALARRDRRCVLMLDDVQELSSPSVLGTLAYVVERAPATLDVVLASRADPLVRLERLRLDGRLAEVRHMDLRFTPVEAAELFAAHDLDLTHGQTHALWELVEGWAAGLRLAAAALQLEPDPAGFVVDAAATQTVAADYLLEEVLAREDHAAQEFLLRTSVTDRLTAELAAALADDARAGERLADLERRGVFLVELDDRQCYRYHALFRALLQARLRQRQPQLVDELHRRAATWCLAQGLTADAEQHARDGGDWCLVGRLVLRRWLAETTEGTDSFATDPLAGMSPAVILDTPELALVAAAEACRWANREDAELYRDRADRSETPEMATGDEVIWDTARRLLDVAFAWTFGTDERSQTAVHAVQALDAAQPWTPRLRQLAVLTEAELDITAGHLDRARSALEVLADHREPQWHRVLAGAVLALLDAATGNVLTADERLAWVRARLEAGLEHPITRHVVQAAAALCAAERGDQRGVAEALASTSTSREWSSASLRCVDRVLRAATRGRAPFFVSLDPETAHHPLAERALVALGVLEVVDANGRPIAIGGEGERAVAEARQRLTGATVNGRRGPTTPVETWLDRSAPRHPRTTVEAGALAAIAAERRHDRPAADRFVAEALDLSMATGIRAPLLDHGLALQSVLQRVPGDHGARATTALDLLDRVRRPGGEALVVPLTDREIEVLQRLPTLMSNTEIAWRLHVSVNTVKTHLKSVYRKLGVDGRRDAVQRGRQLELL